jgi:hypothetical protein
MKKDLKLDKTAARCQQTLTEQHAAGTMPGTILSDIQVLIDFIGVKGLATSSKHGNLPAAVLPELNRRLSQPIELKLQRVLLKDYPNIGGPFALLRVMDLARVDREHLFLNPGTLEIWSFLNPTEKYFALMEAWLIHLDGSTLGENRSVTDSQFHDNFSFLEKHVSNQWENFDEYVHLSRWRGLSTWNTQLQSRFGWIDLKARPLEGRRYSTAGWIMGQARRTPWGAAVLWVFSRFIQDKAKEEGEDAATSIYYNLPEDANYGFFQPAFQPFFPEWQKAFLPPPDPVPSGLYVFKVGFDPRYGQGFSWRRIGVPHEATLADLAEAILAVFDFDNDHLYEFKYNDRSGKARKYYHYGTDEGPYADDITLGECGLPEKQTMKFWFDFGASWRFLVKLERIDPPDPDVSTFKLIESEGQPPKQYGGAW